MKWIIGRLYIFFFEVRQHLILDSDTFSGPPAQDYPPNLWLPGNVRSIVNFRYYVSLLANNEYFEFLVPKPNSEILHFLRVSSLRIILLIYDSTSELWPFPHDQKKY